MALARALMAVAWLSVVLRRRMCAGARMPKKAASYDDFGGEPYTVEALPRGIALNGAPTLLLSGDIHYARAMPEDQERALAMLKADGMNVVQTYAFWSLHEHDRGIYDWGDKAAGPRANITAYLQRCKEAGLFVSLRIGPFICGEWSYGGIPAWINGIDGMTIRAHNTPWETEMAAFVRALWAQVEPFTAKHGGPIIMLQLENEFGPADPTNPYVQYVVDLANSLNSSLPFLWCDGFYPRFDGPRPLVPALNGDDCGAFADQATAAYPRYPLMWTENEGWYHPWGSDPIDGGVGGEQGGRGKALQPAGGGLGSRLVENANRDPAELAFAVARWVARGGAFMNYYMYFGGQHHKQSAAAGNLNSYADGVNIHSDLLPNEPKRSHMAALHHHLMANAEGIMQTPRPIPRVSLTPMSAYSGSMQLAPAEVEGSTDVVAYLLGGADNSTGFAMLENTAGGLPSSFSPASSFSDLRKAAGPGSGACNAAAFAYDIGRHRYKGLVAGPRNAKTETACVEACCALGAGCDLFQFYEDPSREGGPCWTGLWSKITRSTPPPPSGFVSRAKTPAPKPVPPSPSPPHPHPPSPAPSPKANQTVVFRGKKYVVPYGSMTLIGAGGAELFNTRSVPRQAAPRLYEHATTPLDWSCWSELPDLTDLHGQRGNVMTQKTPREQLSVTNDDTEYLVYQTQLNSSVLNDVVSAAKAAPPALRSPPQLGGERTQLEGGAGGGTGTTPGLGLVRLSVGSRVANGFLVFLGRTLVAAMDTHVHSYGDKTLACEWNVSALVQVPATATLTLLSVSIGMHSHVRTADYKGITGQVQLGGVDITHNGWAHAPGLLGETRQAGAGNSSLGWSPAACSTHTPLTWFKAGFRLRAAPTANQSMLLDVNGMSRGHFYLNGNDLGKYWTIEGPSGQPTQRYYHLPTPLLKVGTQENVLVLGDEFGASNVSLPRVVLSYFLE